MILQPMDWWQHLQKIPRWLFCRGRADVQWQTHEEKSLCETWALVSCNGPVGTVHTVSLISPCCLLHSTRHNHPQAFEEMLRKSTFLECFRCGGGEKPIESQDHFGWKRPLASKPLACHTYLTINFALWVISYILIFTLGWLNNGH